MLVNKERESMSIHNIFVNKSSVMYPCEHVVGAIKHNDSILAKVNNLKLGLNVDTLG